MGNTFGPKGSGEPNALVVLFDSDLLASEDLAEVDFLFVGADSAACGDGDGLIVERVVEVPASPHTPLAAKA
jgi:hypothetical protein